MNARDEAWEGGEPTELEQSLERELSELQPWRPSSHLRQRIEAEACRCNLEPAEPERLPSTRRFRFVSMPHGLAALAAAIILLAMAVAPLWIPARDRTVAEGKAASGEQQAGNSGEGARGLILWKNVPGTEEPADGQRDQFLIGDESVRVVKPAEGPAMLQVRYRLLNRTSWKDQETGTMREQFVPEERVLFVPVRHQ